MITDRLKQVCKEVAEKVGIGYDYEKNLLWDEEAWLLMELAGYRCKDGFALEVGTYRGYSACLMGGVRQLMGGRRVYTVDKSPYDSQDAGYTRDRIDKLGLTQWVYPINGPSNVDTRTDLLLREPSAICTLLFIDGDHSMEAVLNDVQTWFPLVHPLGLVVFHDCERCPSVDAAIEQVLKPNETCVASARYLKAYMWGQFK